MSTRKLAAAGAATPDDHCCNCGAGCYYYTSARTRHLAAHESELSTYDDEDILTESFTLCRMCYRLEGELIQQSGHKHHPERLAHYRKMQEQQP